MHQIQRRILLCMIAIFVAMFIYPPYHIVSQRGTLGEGYSWIFDPPSQYAKVDISMLLIQWIGVLIVGGLALFLTKMQVNAPFDPYQGSGANRYTYDGQKTPVDASIPRSDRSERYSDPSGIGGWLLLLVTGMVVLGPLFGAARINGDIMGVELQYPDIVGVDQWKTCKSVTWWSFIAITSLSIYGGWGLIHGRNWSVVKRAQVILWFNNMVWSIGVVLLVPVLTLDVAFIQDPEFLGGFFESLLMSAISAGVWTTYLSKSKRVRATYGTTNYNLK